MAAAAAATGSELCVFTIGGLCDVGEVGVGADPEE